MPSRAVPRTVGDYILYYYAKLVIAVSAGQPGNYRFIIDRYKRLKSGEMSMSDYDREIQALAQQPGVCVFCGTQCNTVLVEVVPRALGGPVGVHNLVHACPECAASKGNKDFVSWWCDDLGRDKDELPRIPAGLFLKIAQERHAVAFGLRGFCKDIRDIWRGGQT
jgi:hypothetical protein